MKMRSSSNLAVSLAKRMDSLDEYLDEIKEKIKEEVYNTNADANANPFSYVCDDCTICFASVSQLFSHRLEHATSWTSKLLPGICSMSPECLLCPLQMHVEAAKDKIKKMSPNQNQRSTNIILRRILIESEFASHLLEQHTTGGSSVLQCCACGGSLNSAVDLHGYFDREISIGVEVLKVGSVYFFGDKLDLKRVRTAKQHRQLHVRYRCLICETGDKCWSKLQLHMRSHAEEDRNNWITHYSDDDEKCFTCMPCGKRFWHQARFENHRKYYCRPCNSQDNRKIGVHAYICDICDATFDDSLIFREHKITHTKLGRKPFKCNLCAKRYTHKERLDKHMLRHNGEKLHGCRFCSKRFNYMSHVKRHLEVHYQNGEKPHNCEHCSKKFATKKCLDNHMFTHTGIKPYLCKYCGKSYVQSSHLQRHMKSHTKDGGRSLQCDQCPKKFASKQVLERHRYTHSGERPYRCTYCPKSYTQPTHLKRHLKTHLQYGERVFECNRCESKFDSKVLLNIHKGTHSEKTYACKCCSSTFARITDLRLHIREHTKNGEKPYKCEHCPKQFTTEKLLERHVQIHHLTMSFTCVICNKEFGQNAFLKRHQKLSVKCSQKLGLRNREQAGYDLDDVKSEPCRNDDSTE